MPIRDLLWACPLCRQYGAIRPQKRNEVCGNCGALFVPSTGARIRVTADDASWEARTAVEWEERLPAIDVIPPNGVLGPQQVSLRIAGEPRPVHYHGNLIGWAERFGKPVAGRARLDAAALTIEAGGEQRSWPLERITAIQPSSSTLQINATGQSLASVRFLEDSVRRWEAVMQSLIRRRHTDLGHGDIADFYPRIRIV